MKTTLITALLCTASLLLPCGRTQSGYALPPQGMDAWAYLNGVRLDFIRPGRPVDNRFIESFDGKRRDECLNTELFITLEDARQKLERWRKDYNEHRPHSALGGIATHGPPPTHY